MIEEIEELRLKIANNKNIIQVMTRDGNQKEVDKAKRHLAKNEKRLEELNITTKSNVGVYHNVNFGGEIDVYEFMSVMGKLMEEDYDEFEGFDALHEHARHDFFQEDTNGYFNLVEITSQDKFPYLYVKEMYTTYNERNDMYHQIWQRKSDGRCFRYSIYDKRYNETEVLKECAVIISKQWDF